MDWINLHQTMESALPIIDKILLFLQYPVSPLESAAASDKAYLDSLLVSLNIQVIKNMCHTLNTAIDIPETKEQKQVTIRPGFDEVMLIRTLHKKIRRS